MSSSPHGAAFPVVPLLSMPDLMGQNHDGVDGL